MTTTAKSPRRSEKLDLRLTPEAKQTLNAAAKSKGRSVSEFVLESALAHAHEILPDRQQFFLNAEQWGKFLEALDRPPRPMPRLQQLMREPSLFERGKK
jgi:uncharacterized protein (DUF1778 family)